METRRKSILSPALFALVLVLFTMPFFQVSCGSQVIGTVSGYDLALGGGDLRGAGNSELGGAMLVTLVALGAAVVGLASGLFGSGNGKLGALCGIGGGVALLFLMMGAGSAASDASSSSYGAVRISTESGLMLSMMALFAAGFANVLEGKRVPVPGGVDGARAAPPPHARHVGGVWPQPRPAGALEIAFCPQCGTKATPDYAFCASCGERLG